mmetsp:Transcript_7393/g.15036  ORF Transcript_7393/g.15036 Transcript_7393/m.15036 type:complete len:123 (-) Transcript_7393:111-479(-)
MMMSNIIIIGIRIHIAREVILRRILSPTMMQVKPNIRLPMRTDHEGKPLSKYNQSRKAKEPVLTEPDTAHHRRADHRDDDSSSSSSSSSSPSSWLGWIAAGLFCACACACVFGVYLERRRRR